MIEVDPSTGLQALDPDYFWQVKKFRYTLNGHAETGYRLRLMMKRKILGIIPLARSLDYLNLSVVKLCADSDGTYLLGVSVDVLKNWRRYEEKQRTLRRSVGDYPPKTVRRT